MLTPLGLALADDRHIAQRVGVVLKPFDIDDLLRAIAARVDAPHGDGLTATVPPPAPPAWRVDASSGGRP